MKVYFVCEDFILYKEAISAHATKTEADNEARRKNRLREKYSNNTSKFFVREEEIPQPN